MKSNMIFSRSRCSRLLLISGALVFALHTQVPLARAGECDEGINPDLFQDNGWDPKDPKNKGKQKPPHQLKKAECEGCQEFLDDLQKALDKCKEAKAAEDTAKADEKKANADKDKAKTAKDKQKAGEAAAKAKQDKEKAGKAAKEAKEEVKKKWEALQDKLNSCPNYTGHKTTTPRPKPLPPAPGPAGPGTAPAPPAPPPKGGGAAAPAPNIAIPKVPPCFDSEKEKNDFIQKLETTAADERGKARADRTQANGKKNATDPAEVAAREQLEASAAQHQANVDALQEAIDAADKAKVPCPSPAPGGQQPGGGGTKPKEQKSMLPPSIPPEQENIAPGPPPTPTTGTSKQQADETSGGSKLETTNSPGVVTKTITVMDDGELVGEVVANLPDDPTGTFTGTVEAKPAGKTDEERTRNQAKLNEVVIVAGGQQTKPADKTVTCTIPTESAKQPLVVVVSYNNKQIVKTSVPAAKIPSTQPVVDQLPWFGQTGRNLVIPHSCDGKVDQTDSVKVGGQTLPLIVETQRMRVVRNVSKVTGPTELEFSEQGQVTRAPFQNMSVQLSADKSRLKPNEKTTLKMNVSGMQGITKQVGLEMVNNSAGIVALRGGNTQHIVLQPSDVGPDGTCLKTFALTGKTPGAFNIRATLELPTKSETHR